MYLKIVIAGTAILGVLLFLPLLSADEKIAVVKLFVLNFSILYFLNGIVKKHCVLFLSAVLILIHVLLGMNAIGWNEGTMSSSAYYVNFLGDVSDLFMGFILLNVFTFLIPLAVYLLFWYSVIRLLCTEKRENSSKFNKN